jgi:hypothetical protein
LRCGGHSRFGDAWFAEQVNDLREGWMEYAAVLADETIVAYSRGRRGIA